MDTTETQTEPTSTTGQSNLSAGELFDVISLSNFCDEPWIGIESGAAILAGQPWLKPERNREAIKDKCYPVYENAYEMHELLLVLESLHPLV